MYWLYNLALAPLAAVAVPALHLPAVRAERERLGLYDEEIAKRFAGRPVVWLHNASVGETLAAAALIEPLRERLPGRRLVASTTTRSGRAIAADLARVDAAVLAPLDWSGCIERALDALHPEVFVFTETEIWPNWLRGLARRGIPSLLVSGRISPRAFARYRLVRPFLERVLTAVSFFGMQSDADAERILALGAPADRVRVTGSLKLDRVATASSVAIEETGPLWIAGSTRPGEEEICLAAYADLRPRHPALRLVLAPRHLERVDEVARLIAARGLPFASRSSLSGAWRGDTPVLLLDTLGELAGLYSRASVAFVGGTLVPIGGHNLLEPAAAAIPIVHGPHLDNVRETAARLAVVGGAEAVSDAGELAAAIDRLLRDPEEARRRGRAGASVAAAAGGGEVAARTLEAAASALPPR